MHVKTLGSLMLGFVATIASLTANAQTTPEGAPAAEPAGTTSATAAATMPDSKMRLGLNVVPMPFGTLKGEGGFSADTAFAFGLSAFFDYSVHPNFFIGVSPQYIFNVKPKDGDGSAAKELDIQLRLGGGAPVSDTIQLYGYLSPGYGIIMPPEGDSAKGFMLGIHAGGMMNVSPTVFVAAELGYQLGFEKVSVGGASGDFKSNFFQVGLGGGLRL
jgi:outer membrane protein with beta-barrel domain